MRRVIDRVMLPAFTVTLLLILLTVTGCASPASAPDLTPESTDQPVDSQPALPQTDHPLPAPESTHNPLKIIIYTDFQCGACEKLHSQVEPELRRLYELTGRARIEVRLLGALGDDSLRAAEVALCAADQGHFSEYQDALFRAWREKDADAYSSEELVSLAGSLGLDEETLRRCLESGCKRTELGKNMSMARTRWPACTACCHY